MKLQFEPGRVRVRASGAEFRALVAGQTLACRLDWPGAAWHFSLRAAEAFALTATPKGVELALPHADLDGLAARLPARDGLHYRLAADHAPLDLDFEIDLHDGRRIR